MAIKISACYIKMTHVLRVRDEWKELKDMEFPPSTKLEQRAGCTSALLEPAAAVSACHD